MISLNDLIQLKKKHPQIAPDVNSMLIRSLSPTQRRIYDLLGERTCLSSRELSSQYGMIQTTAAQAMREMREMGIVEGKSMPVKGAPNKLIYWKVA